jgi:hypothetical protein
LKHQAASRPRHPTRCLIHRIAIGNLGQVRSIGFQHRQVRHPIAQKDGGRNLRAVRMSVQVANAEIRGMKETLFNSARIPGKHPADFIGFERV